MFNGHGRRISRLAMLFFMKSGGCQRIGIRGTIGSPGIGEWLAIMNRSTKQNTDKNTRIQSFEAGFTLPFTRNTQLKSWFRFIRYFPKLVSPPLRLFLEH